MSGPPHADMRASPPPASSRRRLRRCCECGRSCCCRAWQQWQRRTACALAQANATRPPHNTRSFMSRLCLWSVTPHGGAFELTLTAPCAQALTLPGSGDDAGAGDAAGAPSVVAASCLLPAVRLRRAKSCRACACRRGGRRACPERQGAPPPPRLGPGDDVR